MPSDENRITLSVEASRLDPEALLTPSETTRATTKSDHGGDAAESAAPKIHVSSPGELTTRHPRPPAAAGVSVR